MSTQYPANIYGVPNRLSHRVLWVTCELTSPETLHTDLRLSPPNSPALKGDGVVRIAYAPDNGAIYVPIDALHQWGRFRVAGHWYTETRSNGMRPVWVPNQGETLYYNARFALSIIKRHVRHASRAETRARYRHWEAFWNQLLFTHVPKLAGMETPKVTVTWLPGTRDWSFHQLPPVEAPQTDLHSLLDQNKALTGIDPDTMVATAPGPVSPSPVDDILTEAIRYAVDLLALGYLTREEVHEQVSTFARRRVEGAAQPPSRGSDRTARTPSKSVGEHLL